MKKNFWESAVLAAIVLVLVQTFLEDFAVAAGWSWPIRRALIISGFCFDIFFTGEFFARLYAAAINRKAAEYFFYERGWVDFLASIPLAVFNSGPALFGLIAGVPFSALGGDLNVLKVIKAIRIARILRLLRVLKIFRHIKYAESVMAQRHVAKIAGIAVTVFVFAILVFSVVQTFTGSHFLEGKVAEQYQAAALTISSFGETERAQGIKTIAGIEGGLLLVKQDGKTLYSRYEAAYYAKAFGPSDFGYLKDGKLEYFFDLRPLEAEMSRANLSYFAVIVLLLLAFLLYYGPHFAITVSDPLHVMYRGFSEPGYGLEARIPRRYRRDDVYRLAARYNEDYLPLKNRLGQQESGQGLELKMEDYRDLLKKRSN